MVVRHACTSCDQSLISPHRTYVFDGYDGAVQPVTITVSQWPSAITCSLAVNLSTLQGFIPGGNTFNLTPPAGPPSYNWNADLLAGTSVVFAMSDSKGRNGWYRPHFARASVTQPRSGGSSSILLVGESGDNSCINSTTPSSTSNPPSPISTSPGGPSASPPGQNDKKNGGSNSIAIALGSLGGVLALGLVFALIFFYFQRKRKRQNDHSEGSYKFRGNGGPRRMSLDLEEPRPVDDTHDDQTLSHITPFSESHAASSSDYLRPTREDLQGADLIPPRPGPPSSNARSKASQAGSFRQPRYVVHTDVEDAIPEDNDQEVIELPPTYSERRGPAPPSTAGSSLYTEYHSPPPP